MSAPYKIIETHQHTEVVYYDAEGNEIERVRRYDDALQDESDPQPLTDEELADYIG